MKFYTPEKACVCGQSFSNAEGGGGATSFGIVFSHIEWGGAKYFHSLKGGGGAKRSTWS